MHKKQHYKELGATAGCTARLAEQTQYFGNTSERLDAKMNEKPLIYYGDSWFGSLKITLWLLETYGHESIFVIKTNHGGLPKAQMEEIMKDFPSGSNITMKATVRGKVVYFVGYRYNSKKTLLFLLSENAGSLTEGDPYIARFPDSNGNMKYREVPRPAAISKYFNRSNSIDRHNQLRQGTLRLEKSWITKCPWFRMNTTGIGMTVTDAFLLACRSNLPVFDKMTINEFADMMAWDLMNNKCSDTSTPTYIAPMDGTYFPPPPPVATVSLSGSTQGSVISDISPTGASICSSVGVDGHVLMQNPEKEKNGRTKRRKCSACQKKTIHFCMHPRCKKRTGKTGVPGTFLCEGKCFTEHLETELL